MSENKIIFHIILQKVPVFAFFSEFSFLKRKMCKVGSSSCVLWVEVPIESWQCHDGSQTQSPNIQPAQDPELDTKNSTQTDLVKIILIFFLLVMQTAKSDICMRALPSGLLDSILNQVFLLFSHIFSKTCSLNCSNGAHVCTTIPFCSLFQKV